MSNQESSHLYTNTMALATGVVQAVQDMVGADYHVNKATFQKGTRDFHPMMHAVISFCGAVQGEYILSLDEISAAKLTEVYTEGMSSAELRENRGEYQGFVCEALNAAVGQAIQSLKDAFEIPTMLPAHVIYGEMEYPDIQMGYVELEGHAGPLTCSFLLNLMNLKIMEHLQQARGEIQTQKQDIAQLRNHMKQVSEVLPNLNQTVEELFIIQNLIKQNPDICLIQDTNLRKYFEQLSGTSSKLRSILMILWSMPLQQIFEKLRQEAGELSEKLGKPVQVSASGGETEISRQMGDVIFKSLSHMIQNAITHGIESPEERRQQGKSEIGTLRIRGNMKGGYVVIELEDDGRGLNRKGIVGKARRLGLIRPEEVFEGKAADQLIFRAAPRTVANQITLHKIKTVVEKLKGSIEVRSLPGRGTRFVIRFPVAMSITEGIVVGTDSHQYIIPIINIRESLRPKKEACFTVEGKGEMIRLRESLLPLIRLDKLFGSEGVRKNPWDAMVVVVENGEDIGCILVDEVFGKQEIAIQNLGGGGWLDSAKCVAGGSIMASGRVSLVLDIPEIFKCYGTRPSV